MDAYELYQRLEWSFQPETCSDVFPKKGLQLDNTSVIRNSTVRGIVIKELS